MFQGIPDPDSDDTGLMNFYQVFNSFLGMYQVSHYLSTTSNRIREIDSAHRRKILSSENWTDVVNTVLSSEKGRLQIVLAAVFLCAWMFFG